MDNITITLLGNSSSKPGASTWNTNFVCILPVELQIGAFVLMSWPLIAAFLEDALLPACRAERWRSWLVFIVQSRSAWSIHCCWQGSFCLPNGNHLSGSDRWAALSFQVGLTGCSLETSSCGGSLRGQDRTSSQGCPTTPARGQKDSPSSKHCWKLSLRGQEGHWPLRPCRASGRLWHQGNTVALWAGPKSQWPKLLERHDVSRPWYKVRQV